VSFFKVLLPAGKFFLSGVLVFVLSWGLMGCGDRIESRIEQPKAGTELETLAEAAPPKALVQLDRSLARYQPQITIISPEVEEIIADTKVFIDLRVEDLPVYRDRDLDLGPHLAVILDNEPTREIYDLEEPFVLEDLTPGTHTLRVFAVKPWGESFKNEGAYAQTTFSLFTSTPQNTLDLTQPILTYNSPQGNYGTEPILLDFYVANAPLHLVARESNNDAIADWRIRVTVNGKNFLLDRWTPIYLKGFEPGINWVKLEFLDEYGNPVENTFNTSVHLFNYQPNGQDTLSQLIRGELAASDASGIVDPNYKPTDVVPLVEESEEIPSIDEEMIRESSEIEPVELEENVVSEQESSPVQLEEITSEETTMPEDDLLSEPSEEITSEETTIQEEDSLSEPSEEITSEETTAPEEVLETDTPELEVIEEPISLEDNVNDLESPVTQTESLEAENTESDGENLVNSSADLKTENAAEGIEILESEIVEEEAIAVPENSEISESDRGFLRGFLNRFSGENQDSPEPIESATEEDAIAETE
jgi:hypothetical protein